MAADVTIAINAQDNFSGVLGNFGSIVTGIESAIHLAGEAFTFFSDQAMQGLDAIAQYERLTATLETLSAKELLATGEFRNMNDALAEAGPMAQDLLDWMQQLAINSPFTLEGVANAFRTAEAYGFTADEAKRLTQAMIDFAAGSGASEGTMNMIALALGQIEAKGKLAGQEVLQLVNAGLPVTQILADAFGKTTAEIEQMRTDGLIPAKDAIEAITVYLETNFAGAAERQATTWAGLQGTFADIKQMGLREFFGGLFDALQPLAVELSNFLQTDGLTKLGEIGDKIGAVTQSIIDLFYTPGRTITWAEDARVGGEALDDVIKTKIQPAVWKSWDEIKAGVQNRISLWWSNIDWDALGKALDAGIASGIDAIDWNTLGLKFNAVLNENLSTNISAPQTQAAIGKALSDLIAGSFGFISWDQLSTVFWQGFDSIFQTDAANTNIDWSGFGAFVLRAMFPQLLLVDKAKQAVYDLKEAFYNEGNTFKIIGEDIVNGIKAGLEGKWNEFIYLTDQAVLTFINMVKNRFGISSPSTVFAGIGKNIVEGLINGVSSEWEALKASVQKLITDLLDLMPDWLQSFLGLDLTNASGLGTAGGGTGTGGGTTGGGTGGGSSSGGVVNNYYGPVYFQGGSEPGSYYDCPSPNPLVSESGNQLVTAGF